MKMPRRGSDCCQVFLGAASGRRSMQVDEGNGPCGILDVVRTARRCGPMWAKVMQRPVDLGTVVFLAHEDKDENDGGDGRRRGREVNKQP